MDSDLKDLDLYRILGIKRSATKKEIKTAYRRKALQCHPDKNPDNQNAAQVFLWLTEILNILTDTAARLDYDKLLNAKSAAKLLKKERDSDVAKLINDIFKRTKHERSVQRDTDKRSLKDELMDLSEYRLVNGSMVYIMNYDPSHTII